MLKKQQDIGVIGMGIMGRNLALNIEDKGYSVAIYNRSKNKIDLIIHDYSDKNLVPYFSLAEFVLSLKKPRLIILMITSGIYVDNMIQKLSSYLEEHDILIDGGNSFYKDTIRRNMKLLDKKINFIGLGISGGEEGALNGPSLMPGGSKAAYEIVAPILKKIAARIDNEYCVEYIGANGSGHYVKMIHNGIEYGDMQLIAEIFFFLKKIFQLSYKELGKIFDLWNQGELNSYLMDITSHIFIQHNPLQDHVLDYILDVAKNKGTGSWTSQDALDLGVSSTIITESVFARYLSVLKNQRLYASKNLKGPNSIFNSLENNISIDVIFEKTRQALYLGKIILYAQGFYQLKIGSDKHSWNLDYKKIAKIFRSGCIIRSKFLQRIIDIYSENSKIENLLIAPYCINIANNYQQSLRDILMMGINYGIPMPALAAAISYYDGYRSFVLPANLIQAQRDYFGAHTYSRIDKSGTFHTNWLRKS